MRFALKFAVMALALVAAACETPTSPEAREAVVPDPMPPMPADVRALWDNGRDDACGRYTSPRVRHLEPGGAELIRQGRRGWVVVRLTVGTQGAVTQSDVVASAPAGLFDRYAEALLDTNTYPPRQDECTTYDVVWMGGGPNR